MNNPIEQIVALHGELLDIQLEIALLRNRLKTVLAAIETLELLGDL